VLAPGDSEAEPGEPNPNTSQPTKWATDETCKALDLSEEYSDSCVACFAGSTEIGALPQARLRHRLGLALSPPASQAA